MEKTDFSYVLVFTHGKPYAKSEISKRNYSTEKMQMKNLQNGKKKKGKGW